MRIIKQNQPSLPASSTDNYELKINSEHWERLLKIEDDINLDRKNILNNFTALKAVDKLKNHQISELRFLHRHKVIDKKEYLFEKKFINDQALSAKNEILEELSYNTSFILARYSELTELQKHTRIREINKRLSKAQRETNRKIKLDKKRAKRGLKEVITTYKQNNVSDEKIIALENEYINQVVKKNIHQKNKQKKINEGLVKSTKSTSYQTLAIIIAIAVPTLLLVSLLTNFLVYMPKIKGAVIESGKSAYQFNHLTTPGFVLAMVLVCLTLLVTAFLIFNSTKRIVIDANQKTTKLASIGFVSSFFDILGIGSFATSLGMIKATKTITNDKLVPGTLNISFCVPITMEATFLVGAINVDIVTLVVLVICAVIGSYLGASLINKFDGRIVKIVISAALFIAAIIMILTTPQVHLLGAAQGARALTSWWKWLIGILGFLLVGILMSFGVGSYAPSIVILSLLGMGMIYIAPIMTCSSAFLMPVTSYRFYKDNNYLPKTSLIMMLGGIFGATTAFLFFYVGIQAGVGLDRNGIVYQSLIKWITVVVMLYTSLTMFLELLSTPRTKQISGRKKHPRRIPLSKIVNKQDLDQEIKKQYQAMLSYYHNDLDTKKIVEAENIPINEWIKTSNDKKTQDKDSSPFSDSQENKTTSTVNKKT